MRHLAFPQLFFYGKKQNLKTIRTINIRNFELIIICFGVVKMLNDFFEYT